MHMAYGKENTPAEPRNSMFGLHQHLQHTKTVTSFSHSCSIQCSSFQTTCHLNTIPTVTKTTHKTAPKDQTAAPINSLRATKRAPKSTAPILQQPKERTKTAPKDPTVAITSLTATKREPNPKVAPRPPLCDVKTLNSYRYLGKKNHETCGWQNATCIASTLG